MESKIMLSAFCLLAVVLMVQGNQAPDRQAPASAPARTPALRYKRMFVMCPPSFIRIGNECYYISKNKLNWLDAYFECKDRNAKLAEPMKYEDKHLRRHLQKTDRKEDLWIGGTYNWKLQKWQWGHNGREIEHQSFSQMVPGRDLKFHCALLRSDIKFRWSAEECTKKMDFICQHRMPLVTEQSRNQVYSRWNETFPNQKANEKMVYIVNDPNNRTRSDPSKVRIYNSVKQVYRFNPSIHPPRQPTHRRNRNRGQKPNREEYIPNDVYRKQQVSQYAPEATNELTPYDNGVGYRNGYSVANFNVDIRPRTVHKKEYPRPNNRAQTGGARQESMQQQHHQHRHQPTIYNSQQHKPTNRQSANHTPRTTYYRTEPTIRVSPTTTTTTTTSTTTTTTPAPRFVDIDSTTMRAPYLSRHTTKIVKTAEEKKAYRDKVRERFSKLTPEQQQMFLEERARRKQLQRQRQQQNLPSANEVAL
ncbi:probable serine/threonine-protein kinase DDB_G0280133 isoform X2 [Anopheles albimanus]|uniref:probable serine/threonine-protein kinase DDB_G0280133 isoform X2 n=1 Tax=Anopheles albimanus TaxID=7167 RepID=UPI00163EF0BD|nr:probable serine/threonine-protein kinase DDB_G0280133 isoform X2 [Anopheles albimanus]